MIKTSFTCNSLRTKHFVRFLWGWLFCNKPSKYIDLCKNKTAEFFNVKPDSVFLFGSARMGLYSLLMSGKTEGKNEVIVAGYTCVVVTNAIKYAGLEAVYIDVEEDKLNIDPDLLRNAITSKTYAIIFTHNYGITCDYVEEFKAEFPEIMIIEDAAHTFGSITKAGKKAGTLGHASFFSLEYSKPITSGMGGIIIVNDSELKDDLTRYYAELRNYPKLTNFRIFTSLKIHLFSSSRYTAFLKKWMSGFLYLTCLLYKSPPGELQGEMPGNYPVKLSPYLAYIADMQINEIESVNRKKDKLCKAYNEAFEGISGIRQYYCERYNFVRYPLLFDASVPDDTINRVKNEMKKAGIVPGEWFNDVVHPKGSLRYCYIDGSCPVGESVSSRMLNLPVTIHKQLNKRDLKKVRDIFIRNLQA